MRMEYETGRIIFVPAPLEPQLLLYVLLNWNPL